MPFGIAHQRLGRLFGSHDAGVGDQAAVHGLRVVEIDRFPREIGAIVRQKTEAGFIRPGIQ
jgi:hypothetical protein